MALAATGIVKEQLDPQLAMNKPKWISDIHLHNFNLGGEPPSISGVKVTLCMCTLTTPSAQNLHCLLGLVMAVVVLANALHLGKGLSAAVRCTCDQVY